MSEVWSPQEDERMVELLRSRVPYPDMAKAIGRSVAAIQVRLSNMRKSDPTLPRRQRAADEDIHASQQDPTEFMRRAKDTSETQTEVERRAKKLTELWHRRGYPSAAFWCVHTGKDRDNHNIFELRSNLVNGLPPKQHPAIRQSNAAE